MLYMRAPGEARTIRAPVRRAGHVDPDNEPQVAAIARDRGVRRSVRARVEVVMAIGRTCRRSVNVATIHTFQPADFKWSSQWHRACSYVRA
jgi:hypothetical protein